MRALGEFGATLMLAGNIPGQTQTLPIAIYFAVEAGDMQQASVWVVTILGISLTVLTAVNFWSDSQRPVVVEARREDKGARGQGDKGTRGQGDKKTRGSLSQPLVMKVD